MEIQTFLLAEKITRKGGHNYDVQNAALSVLSVPPGTPFPLRFGQPALALLGRESESAEEPVGLRFDLMDEDGRPAGLPRRLTGRWAFPAGSRYCYAMLHIDFEFPRPGWYRLDIADEGPAGGVHQYNIDIAVQGEG